MQTGRLLVISGPSGAGKGTICQSLFKRTDNIVFSVSMTTRAPRDGEVHGKNYYFVSKEDFEKKIAEGGFLEYAKVFENYYGTPKQAVIDKLNEGKDVILEIDIQGAMQIKEAYPQAVFIFILPPSMQELRKRITGRGTETEESLNLRLGEALNEISYVEKYDYAVVNGELGEAVDKVESIIAAEHSKVSQDVKEIIESYKEEI